MKKIIFSLLILIGQFAYSQDTKSDLNNYVPNEGAMLYFYRPSAYTGAIVRIEVFVNGLSIAKMGNNSTYKYNITETGKTVIRVEGLGINNKNYCSPDEITIQVENGKFYFIQVEWSFYNMVGPQQVKVTQVSYQPATKYFLGLETLIKDNPQVIKTSIQNDKKAIEVSNKKNTDLANVSEGVSDIDIDIPVNTEKRPYRFALIIGNEDYSSFQTGLTNEVNVAYAVNDAKSFREYANQTLGVPEENTILLLNARAIEMSRAINKMNLYAKNLNGKAQIYIYYAGHGFPDELTNEPYLMPVDVSGSDLQFAIKLSDLYKKMTEYKTQNVTVFLDACFSGGGRNQGLIAARGVKIRPKESTLSGSLIVFASSSGDQSSLSFKEKKHGMFTYFLLKKIRETNGQISYKDLSNYLSEQVVLNSIRVNDKEQNPQLNYSSEIQNEWENWILY